MSSPKIVFFNCPPRTGKDSSANYLYSTLGAKVISYGDFPKAGAHASFGLNIGPRDLEKCKDQPHESFFGLTPRQAYIKHGEDYMKALYGRDIYARMMALKLGTGRKPALTVVTDAGFKEEIEALIPVYGVENMLIVRLARDGYTFERFNDSRRYVDIPDIEILTVTNPENQLNDMLEDLGRKIQDWMMYGKTA